MTQTHNMNILHMNILHMNILHMNIFGEIPFFQIFVFKTFYTKEYKSPDRDSCKTNIGQISEDNIFTRHYSDRMIEAIDLAMFNVLHHFVYHIALNAFVLKALRTRSMFC